MVELHKISSTILKYVLDVKKLKKTLIYQCFSCNIFNVGLEESDEAKGY